MKNNFRKNSQKQYLRRRREACWAGMRGWALLSLPHEHGQHPGAAGLKELQEHWPGVPPGARLGQDHGTRSGRRSHADPEGDTPQEEQGREAVPIWGCAQFGTQEGRERCPRSEQRRQLGGRTAPPDPRAGGQPQGPRRARGCGGILCQPRGAQVP